MGGGTQGLGQELLAVHRQLRARVSSLERTVRAEAGDVAAFRDSCLAFCRALRRHHLGEDDGAFPVLRRHRPDLADTLDALVRDHEFLDPLLDRLDPADGPAERARLRAPLDGVFDPAGPARAGAREAPGTSG